MSNYYAVRTGRSTGIYRSWDECEAQVRGYSGAVFKKFKSYDSAQEFVQDSSRTYQSYHRSNNHYSNDFDESESESDSDLSDDGPKYSAPTIEPRYSAPAQRSYHARQPARSIARESSMHHHAHSRPRIFPKPSNSSFAYSSSSSSSSSPSSKSSSSSLPPKPKISREERKESSSRPTVVYTDGSCLGNGSSRARAGYGAHFVDHPHLKISDRLEGVQTNNRAELSGVIQAVKTANRNNIRDLEIRTDSQLLVKSMNEWMPKWKKKNFDGIKNSDLLQELDSLVTSRKGSTSFKHVRAHNGEHGNELADKLANEGAMKPSKRR